MSSDRVIAGIRQSKRKELSESPATQRGDIERWVEREGNLLVAEALDIGVSASIEPAKRKSLGPWLTDPHKLSQWDVLAVWKVDRAVRDMTHFYGLLVPKLQELGKHVVAVTEGIDTRTSSAMEIAMRVSLAQEELKKLQDRASASRARLRERARWGGGPCWFGFQPVKTPEGYKLVHDEEAVEWLYTVRDLLRAKYNPNYITSFLNQEGVMTAWDRNAVRMGRDPKGRPWRRKTLVDMLSSRKLMGQFTYQGEVVRGEDGQPLLIGEPIFSREEWNEIQECLARSKDSKAAYQRRKGESMLRQVAFCNWCGRAMHRHPGGDKDVPRYICSVRAAPGIDDCKAAGFPCDVLEEAVEEAFLENYGDLEVEEIKATAVVDHTTRIQEISESLDQLEKDRYVRGRFKGEEGDARFHRLYAALEAERDELLSAQSGERGIERTKTGKTYRQLWDSLDREGRGDLLRHYGVTVMAQWPKVRNTDVHLTSYLHMEFPMLDHR